MAAEQPGKPDGAAGSDDGAHFKAFVAKDPKLMLHNATYCVLCAAWSFFMPFVVVLLGRRGLSPTEIGAILAIPPFSQLAASPFWSGLADRKGWRRELMVGTSTAGVLLRLVLYFAPPTFWPSAVVVFLYECTGAAVMPLLDAATFAMLQSTMGTRWYGHVRAWGAIGWGACSLLAGALVDAYGVEVMFLSFALSMLPATYLLRCVPVERKKAGSASTGAAWQALMTPQVLVFFIVAFIMGVLGGVISSFLFLWLTELGASATLLGLTLTFTCISETPMFFIAPQLLERFGTPAILMGCLACYGLRLLYYSFLTDPWWTLPGELLHGITFALGWAACSQSAHAIAPPALSSTFQGLLASVQWGLGAGTGSLLGGVVYQAYGPRILFRAASTGSLIGMGVLGCAMVLMTGGAVGLGEGKGQAGGIGLAGNEERGGEDVDTATLPSTDPSDLATTVVGAPAVGASGHGLAEVEVGVGGVGVVLASARQGSERGQGRAAPGDGKEDRDGSRAQWAGTDWPELP